MLTSAANGDNSATAARPAGRQEWAGPQAGDDRLGQAIGRAAVDPGRICDVLRALAGCRIWIPVPGRDDASAGAAVTLPVLRYLGNDFVPAFTSYDRLMQGAPAALGLASGTAVAHLVARAADLARTLPAGVGIALNPGAGPSVAVSPDGLADLAVQEAAMAGASPGAAPARRGTHGRPPGGAGGVLAGMCLVLAAVPPARSATAGWLSDPGAGGTLVIAVDLEDPGDPAVQRVLASAAGRAAAGGQADDRVRVAVAFPGASPPSMIESWVAAAGTPFYRR